MFRIFAAVSMLIFLGPPLAIAEESLSCKEYLGNHEGSRERIIGSFLWVILDDQRDKVTPNAAGTLISTVPEMRAMVDAGCSADKETRVFSVAASVIFPFVQAALTDPEIR